MTIFTHHLIHAFTSAKGADRKVRRYHPDAGRAEGKDYTHYQCKNAFLLNMAANWSWFRLKSSWIAVELPIKVAESLKPVGGMLHIEVSVELGCFGRHSIKIAVSKRVVKLYETATTPTIHSTK